MSNPKWIDAEERLPSSGPDVFILCEDSERMTGDRGTILSLQKSGYRDILWLDESGLEKGEQVEGKGFENISRIIHPATESTDRTLPFAPSSVEADHQVPEEFYHWVDMWIYSTLGSGKGQGFDDKKRLAQQIAVAAAHYFISGEISTLKESFNSSIYQHDQDMEIVKGERDEYRKMLENLAGAKAFGAMGRLVNKITPLLNHFTNKE